MPRMDILTLHADDYTVVGQAANAVNLIEINHDAVEQREKAQLFERIAMEREDYETRSS